MTGRPGVRGGVEARAAADARATARRRLATVGRVSSDGTAGGLRGPARDAWWAPGEGRRVMRVVGPALGVVWVVFLLQPWQAAWASTPGVERDVSLAAVALLAASFTWVVISRAGPFGRPTPVPLATAVLAGQLVLVALSALAAEEYGLVGLVFVGVSAIFLLRDPRALLVAPASIAAILVLPRAVPGWEPIDDLVISVVLATLAVFGFTQLVQRNRQLQAARDEVAVLAVEQERERIARDMHDILGHSLTVISVKAELAARLMDVDADRARAEVLEVQGLARSALADVRGMVAGTRAVTLAGELAGARQAFDAAGIEADVPGALDAVPDHLRELFAWAVREGTTNVLRHAAATRVSVTLSDDTLTIDDDGAADAAHGSGHGLAGLSERARRAGARVETGRGPLGGYRLRVTAAPTGGAAR